MESTKVKKSIFKKWWFWVIVVLVIGAIGGVINQNKTNSKSSKNNTTTTVTTTAKATTKETTTVPPTTKSAKEVEKEYINSCKTIDFKTLARNPNKYKGDKFKFTGEVIQVQESEHLFDDNTTVDLRINVTKGEYGIWEDTIFATVELSQNADKILEDDIITIWGKCDGDYTYESVLGSDITLPKMNIEYYSIS